MKALEDTKTSVLERTMEASKLYKDPPKVPGQLPNHRYTLRGVRTSPFTMYVLERTAADDDNAMLGSSAIDYEWWKIEFNPSSSTPVQTSITSEEVVLNAASTDSNAALLVYASDQAISYESHSLPPQLAKFVRADNSAFQAELENHNIQNTTNDFELPSIQKRKAATDGDSDLEVEYDRSPGARSTGDGNSSNASSPLDATSETDDDFDYRSAPPPPGPRLRPLEPKPRAIEYTDSIPVSLRQDHEMQESGGGKDILKRFARNYESETYTPEMDVDDSDEGYAEEKNE